MQAVLHSGNGTHIFMACPVINELYNSISSLLMEISPIPLMMKEKAMGLKLPSKNSNEEILRNYVTSAINYYIILLFEVETRIMLVLKDLSRG